MAWRLPRRGSDQDRLERAYEAYDEGDFEAALELAAKVAETDGRRWVLQGLAREALDDLEGSRADLQRARASGLDAEDPELCWAEAALLLREWRFDEAERAFEAIARAERSPEVLERLSFCRELAGDFQRADALYREASHADPELFPPLVHVSEADFDAVLHEAIERLPPHFRELLLDTEVVVQQVPGRELLVGGAAADMPPDLLGLLVGPSIPELEVGPGGEPTPVVYLFQRNLERATRERDELCEQIAVTLYHELGHLLGFDEEGVAGLGLE